MPNAPRDAAALDDLLDRLVAEYSDRLALGKAPNAAELLEQVPEEHRPALARCFKMIDAGIASAPRASCVLGPGAVLGGFEIERELGRGGMAIVYVAKQKELARRVALKVLRPGLAVEGRHVDRFRREALAIARLQHPHIVQVYAVGEDLGWHFLAMELVDGRNLAEVYAELAAKPARERTAADLARAARAPAIADPGVEGGEKSYEAALAALLAPVARAIAVAHELGIVHRDVKPSNILIHADGRALIADFGLAKGDGDPGLSLTGEPLGTPYYMSPEQADASTHAVDERTDVYSLGVTLYEGLAGQRPFEGASALAVLDLVRSSQPERMGAANPRVTKDAAALVERAMARAKEARYASALDLAADLVALAEGRPTRARMLAPSAAKQFYIHFSYTGQPVEYRSRATFLGLPWFHVNLGRRAPGAPARVARGWLALGDVAVGGLAIGGQANGIVSLGGITTGIFAFGGVALGVFPVGGLAAGLMALGGLAFGWNAFGGCAIAKEHAAGGYAVAQYRIDSQRRDPEAIEYFRAHFEPVGPWLVDRIERKVW